MVTWLNRLLRRGAQQDADEPIDGGSAAGGIAVATRDSSEARRSVWNDLAGDPGAAALRAQWEARWDEF